MSDTEFLPRKIKLSIHTKLVTLIVGIVVISLPSFLYFAVDLFKKDKSAYVFETTLNNVESMGQQLDEYFKNALREAIVVVSIARNNSENKELYEKIFSSNENLMELLIYNANDSTNIPVMDLKKTDWLVKFHQNSDYFDRLLIDNPIPIQLIKEKKMVVLSTFKSPGIPHLSFLAYDKASETIIVARLLVDPIMNAFRSGTAYQNYVTSPQGKLLLFSGMENSKIVKDAIATSDVLKLTNSKQQKGVKEITKQSGNEFLMAFSYLPQYDLLLISEIDKKIAFESQSYLINKSALLAILLISIAVLLGVLMARSLTKPIELLFEGTKEVARGNFEHETSITSNDELGVLSDSFNFMNKEIIRYMQEVKEKARMENELAVANLVQSSFFPETEKKFGPISIAGFYRSASECGGDWIGYKEFGDKVCVFIGDATGHGVPAALVTATSFAFYNLIEDLAKNEKNLLENPAKLLEILNKVIHAVGGKVLMTLFVAVIDKKSLKLTYSNASHDPPLLYRKSDEKPSKQDIEALLGESGTRLGHVLSATYQNTQITMNIGDILMLTTDGIIEGKNPDGKEWGDRNFMKTFLSNVDQPAPHIISNIVKTGYDFFNGVDVGDDVTLVAVKIEK